MTPRYRGVMQRRIGRDFVFWQTRITLRMAVKEAVETLAADQARTTSSMIGVLLAEALTARSSA